MFLDLEKTDKSDILTDYENYDLLNKDQKAILVSLAILFDPNIFIRGGVFILDPSLVPEGSDNEFYQITDERINFHFNDEIMIGGKTRKILKVMACAISWLERFYYNPLNNIMSLITAKQPSPPRPPKYGYYPEQNNRPKPTYMTKPKDEDDCCCLIY